MKFINFFCLCAVFLNFVGCALNSKKGDPYFQDETFLDSYKIFDAAGLKKGKKILIIPFKAGRGIEANESLDSLSLMLIKGVHDGLKDKNDAHVVLAAPEAETADLILKGYITRIQTPGKFGGLIGSEKPHSLTIEANLIDKKTGQMIAVFKQKKESLDPMQSLKHLAHFIGQDIAQSIINESSK